MTRIALIGAPGSGKRDLAVDLFHPLDLGQVVGGYDKVLIDNDMPVGESSTYREGIVLHAEQYRQEYTLRRDGASFIARGTGVERVAHALVKYHEHAASASKEERKISDIDLIGVEMLSALMIDGMVYDVVFYLPLATPTDPPSSSDATVYGDPSFEATVDEAIRQVISDFAIQVVYLDGSDEERLAKAILVVNELMENDGQEDNIRTSTEATELPD